MNIRFTLSCILRYSHCGDVLSRKGIGGVADEQACLTHSSGREKERKKCVYFISPHPKKDRPAKRGRSGYGLIWLTLGSFIEQVYFHYQSVKYFLDITDFGRQHVHLVSK